MQKIIKFKRKIKRKFNHNFKLLTIKVEEAVPGAYIDYHYQCITCKCYMFHYKQLWQSKKILFFFSVKRSKSFTNKFLSCQEVIIKSIIE